MGKVKLCPKRINVAGGETTISSTFTSSSEAAETTVQNQENYDSRDLLESAYISLPNEPVNNRVLEDIEELYRIIEEVDAKLYLPIGEEILRFEPDYGNFDEAALTYDGEQLQFETRDKDPTGRFIRQRLTEDWEEAEESGAELGKRVLG